MVDNERFLGRKIFYTKIDNSPSIYGKVINIVAALIMPFYFLAYPQLMVEETMSMLLKITNDDIVFYLFQKGPISYAVDLLMIGSLGLE